MKVSELHDLLEGCGYGPESYRILEPPDDTTWCIHRRRSKWIVFFFERGRRSAARRFKAEEEACEYFLSHFPFGRPTWPRG